MLEGVTIELCIIIKVVWIGEKVITCAEHIATAYVRTGQSHLLWTCDLKDVFIVAIQCLTYFIAQIGVGVFITQYLYCIVYAGGTMVCGQYHFVA